VRRTKGNIRKVTIGPDPLKAMAFEVDREYRSGMDRKIVITQIVEDIEHFHSTGMIRFLVEAKDKQGNLFVWKEFENMPFLLEYSLPEGNEVEKV
jgi:hypothetical protein